MGSGRILVVDDEPDLRKTVRMILTKSGYEVFEAEDGLRAIEILRSGDQALPLDVVVADIRMPRINGVELIAYILKEFPSKRIIVQTGYPDIETATSFLRQGIIDYLIKPVNPERLLAAVSRAFAVQEYHPYGIATATREARADEHYRKGSAEAKNVPLEFKQVRGVLGRLCERLGKGIRIPFQSLLWLHKVPILDVQTQDAEREVLASVVHNLKRELTLIASSTARLREQVPNAAVIDRESATIEGSVEYANLAVQRLLQHMGLIPPGTGASDLGKVLRKVEELIRPRLPSNITLLVTQGDEASARDRLICTRAWELLDVLVGVIQNAVQALDRQGGTIRVTVTDLGNRLRLTVDDDGPGIPEAIRSDLLTRPVPSRRGGMGVGLYLYNKVIRNLGGTLAVDSSSKGATVTLLLPKRGTDLTEAR